MRNGGRTLGLMRLLREFRFQRALARPSIQMGEWDRKVQEHGILGVIPGSSVS
jgi:hypothetical protein